LKEFQKAVKEKKKKNNPLLLLKNPQMDVYKNAATDLKDAQKTYKRTSAYKLCYMAIGKLLAEENGGAAIPKVEDILLGTLPYMDDVDFQTQVRIKVNKSRLFKVVDKIKKQCHYIESLQKFGSPLAKITTKFRWPFGKVKYVRKVQEE